MKVNQIFFGLFSCFVLSISTVYAHQSDKAQTSIQTHPKYEISQELEEWNNNQKLRLQRHQLRPIDYLERFSDIKGLIVNHYLGTGKTLLSIGFAERNPDCSIIVLAPDFLRSHWLNELEKYGVKNKARYRFLGHNACQTLAQEDLSNTIVIIDEAHRFVQKVRYESGLSDDIYSRIYFNIRKSSRILALSGTPIYQDMFDLVYLTNLVSGKDVFPFNHEQFRVNFSRINRFNAFWRGYLLPDLCNLLTLQSKQIGPVGFLLSSSLSILPLTTFPGRMYDISKLKEAIQSYISYYTFNVDAQFYPSASLYRRQLPYNRSQLNFLYNYYDSKLKSSNIKQLLKDHPTLGMSSDRTHHSANIDINSSVIQERYKYTPGAGREIGNLMFMHTEKNGTKNFIIPDKFKLILSALEVSDGPIVIYSHYYHNGLLYFKQFLDESGYKGTCRVFHPEMSKEEHTEIVSDFNNGKIKVLLLHSDITEGISLKGVRQLHFLEIPISSALKNQVIGRTVRYNSHIHLPEDKRHVMVYMWEYHMEPFGVNENTLRRKNWHLNFSERSYSAFEIDAVTMNAIFKSVSPDSIASYRLNVLNQYIEEFQKYMRDFSIENIFYHD